MMAGVILGVYPIPNPKEEPNMKRYSYKILENKLFKKPNITEENLNKLGMDGYELVEVIHTEGQIRVYLKKEL